MTAIIDENEINGLISDIGREDFIILLNAFLSECSSKLNSLKDNLDKTEHDQLELDSHTLKSLSRTFGAVALGDACSKLENAAKNQEHMNYQSLFGSIKTNADLATNILRKEYY